MYAAPMAPGDYGWIAPTYNVDERGKEALRDIAGGFVRFGLTRSEAFRRKAKTEGIGKACVPLSTVPCTYC